MKVPNIEDARDEVNDVALYRKKKKIRGRIRTAIFLIVGIAFILVMWFYADVIFEPFRGIASKVNTTTSDKAGYPVELPASSGYRFLGMSDSYALLTDTYLYAYNANGGQNFALQHGYTNPSAVSNSKRVLIYDRGGHDFALYNKTSEIYKQSIPDEVIVSAFIGESEQTAIVTSGGRYSNIVYVYDGNGKWLYTHRFIDDNVMQAGFSPDNSFLYLTKVHSENGDIITELTKYKLGSENEVVWSCKINDSIPMKMLINPDYIQLFCDGKVVSVNPEDGNITGELSYSGKLKSIDCAYNQSAFIVADYASQADLLVLINESCEIIEKVNMKFSADRLICNDNGVYLLSDNMIYQTNNSLITIHEKKLEDNYSDMICIGEDVLLLGYNEIIKINLSNPTEDSSDDENSLNSSEDQQ